MADTARVHIRLTGQERQQLHAALCGAFDHTGLAKLLSFQLNERLDAIATQGGLDEVMLEVIEWAEIRGRVVELAEAAKRQQPDNAALVAACQTVEASASRPRTPEPADDASPASPPVRAARGSRGRTGRTQPPASDPAPPPPAIPTSATPVIPTQATSPPPVIPVMSPTATIGLLQIVHNLMVPHPGGLMPGLGMRIVVPGMLQGAMGQIAQLVVRFVFPNGQMLVPAPQEIVFRDPNGYCATGTAPTPVTTPIVDLSASMIMIPYYALNLTPTNGMMIYQFNAVASLYVNNMQVAQSSPMPVSVRW